MSRLIASRVQLTLLTAVFAAAGLPAGLPSLVTNSPFLPPGFQPPGSAAPAPPPAAGRTQYEFRGVYQLEDMYHFHLYDTRERKGFWLTEEAPREGVLEVLEFDPESNEVVVTVAGEQISLALVRTSDQPMPIQTPTPVARPVVRPPMPQPAVRPATPAVRPATPAAPTTPAAPQPVRRRVIRPTSSAEPAVPVAPARRPVVNLTLPIRFPSAEPA